MNLADRCRSLANSISEYNDLKSNADAIEHLGKCYEKLVQCRIELDPEARSANVLRKHRIPLRFDQDPDVREAIEFTDVVQIRLEERATRLTEGNEYRNLILALQRIAAAFKNTSGNAWNEKCETSIPSVDTAIEAARLVMDNDLVGSLTGLQNEAEILSKNPPTTEEAYQQLDALVKKMRTESAKANTDSIPADVRRFFEYIGKGSRTNSVGLEYVTPGVLGWLRDHGRLKEFTVRRS